MSYLKDSKYVQNLSNQCGYRDLTHDACKYILADVELTLRELIKKSIKYMRLAKKNVLTETEINLVLKEINLDFILNHSQKTLQNKFFLDKQKNIYNLKSENIEIQNFIKQIIKKTDEQKNKQKFQLKLDWLEVPKIKSFQPKKKSIQINKNKNDNVNNFENYIKKFYDPNAMNQFIIKNQSPNYLSKVFQKGRK